MPGPVTSALSVEVYFIFTYDFRIRFSYYLQFTQRETEALGGHTASSLVVSEQRVRSVCVTARIEADLLSVSLYYGIDHTGNSV